MSLPIVLAVAEAPNVLGNLCAQLTARYERDYRVECVDSRDAALSVLDGLSRDAEDLALMVAEHQVWSADEGRALERVRALHPHAKRVLLVRPDAWADPATAASIRDSVSLGRIDYYVIRPAPGTDEAFHQAISSFLLEWATDRRLVPQTIHVVGEEWAGRAYELREVLERCAVPHAFCLADSDRGRELMAQAGPEAKLPLIVLPNGHALGDPTNADMARVAGVPTGLELDLYDVVIVGSGPAGLSAAVYGASEGLRTLVVDEGGIGGQARSSSLIRNYLGFPKGISGSLLAEQAYEQASVFGANFLFMTKATALRRTDDHLTLSLVDGRGVRARSVILATGARYRRIGVPALEELTGAGVFYGGAASEAHALGGKAAFVVGGGNSAGQAALHLARHARSVTLLIRGPAIEAGMSTYLVREIEATPSVEVLTDTVVSGGGGTGRLERLVLRHTTDGAERTVPADALFALIGARPQTDWLPAELARDGDGFLLTGEELDGAVDWPLARRPLPLETSMPGVLAAGDVRRAAVKRVASAVGEGSIAIKFVHGLLGEVPTVASWPSPPDRVA